MIALLLAAAFAAEPVLLDAGSLASPRLAGFGALHPEGSDDPRVSWETPPRGARWCRGPDPLVGDHVEGGALRLALEPGPWEIRLQVGRECGRPVVPGPGLREAVRVDGAVVWAEEGATGAGWFASAGYAAAPFPVFREGETAWERQVLPHHPWHAVRVEVPPGGVVLEVEGAALQGLLAVPAQAAAEGEVEQALADAQRRAWFLERFAPGPWDLPSTEGTGVQVAGWSEWPDPARATADARIDRVAAPGERVGAVAWLFPGDAGGPVRVEGLDGLDVEVVEVHWLDASGIGGRPRRPRPAFLRPTDHLRGGQGVPAGVGLVARVPEDAEPALLAGRLVVERSEGAVEVPITVRVRDLDLLPTRAPVGVFADLRPIVDAAFAGDPEASAAVRDADLVLMRSRGLEALAIRYATPWPDGWEAGAEPDTSRFEDVAARWEALGGRRLVWHDPGPWLARPWFQGRARLEAWEPVWRGVAAAAVARDAPLFVYDEWATRGIEHVAEARDLAAWVRALSEPAPSLLVAALHPVSWELAGDADVVLMTSEPAPSSEAARWVRERGAEPWLYNLPPGRAASGLLPWLVGADGMLQWHWAEPSGDPFDDLHGRPQYQMTYLAPDLSVWSTPLLEAFADGVDDQRVLVTLEALVEEAEGSRSRRRRRAAAPGRALLDAVRALDGQAPMGIHDGQAWSWDDLARIRRAAGDEAEALQRCLRGRCQ